MINITLNNEQHDVESTNLVQLISELNISTAGIAIGVNSRVIARGEWQEYQLQQGDKIVIVSAVFGG